MRKKVIDICILFFLLKLHVFSQEGPINLTYESTMLAIGASSVYDSYFSPLQYDGMKFGFISERMKIFSRDESKLKLVSQHFFDVAYLQTANPTGTAVYRVGTFQYDYGLFYKLRTTCGLRLYLGAQIDCMLGFILNSRNGNNPATGKFHTGINLSSIASYALPVSSFPVRFSWQLSFPSVGVMYSPEFGQSYYEIGLGNRNNLLHLSSFHNYLFFKNIFTIEIPSGNTTFRVGYTDSFYQTRISNLETKLRSNDFYLGVSRNFFVAPGKKLNQYRHVFE
ncbi:MAG: DUF3316 domain-containing protein [Dysgonamonadaceae bacterium]|jgi:hypothetical protein|nr:DUF3316 domain-containing protein [Dysgonamonadaceae bacterium]